MSKLQLSAVPWSGLGETNSLDSQWTIRTGYVRSIMGYFGVWWLVNLGNLAFQEDPIPD